MNFKHLTFVAALLGLGIAFGVTGCKTGGKAGGLRLGGGNSDIGRALGIFESASEVGEAHAKATKELSERQMYYVGRSAAANVIAKDGVSPEQKATDYLNLLGQSLARFSDRPEVHNGYRFAIINSDAINAFATPGSYIFVSKGLLKAAGSEDELAAVLAHELAHIELRHPKQTIKQSLGTASTITLLSELAKHATKQNNSKLDDAHRKLAGNLAQTWSEKGYSRDSEFEADAIALSILDRAGYDRMAMIRVLEKMQKKHRSGGIGFDKTHPSPKDRMAKVRAKLGGAKGKAIPAARQSRFELAMAGIRG
jgi:predicted Zn-dependent protease